MRLSRAVDMWMGELARGGRARPRRPRPEDLDVVIVLPAEVEKMLAATEG